MKYSIKTVVLIAVVVLSSVIIDATWKVNLENSARTQAKFNLNQVKLCVNTLLLSDDKGLLTRYRYIPEKEITKALFTCSQEMKVTQNGDIWAYSLRTKEYVFDSSLRYIKKNGGRRYWDVEHICRTNKPWCLKLVREMNSGYDSKALKESWLFKHSKEYLEWIILPDENRGYDGLGRTGTIIPQQYVVIQGARENELMERYKWFRVAIYLTGLFMILIILIINNHERK